MAQEPLLWLVAFLVGVVVALVVVIAVVLLPRAVHTRAVTARFHCPWRERNVVLRYLTDRARRPLSVVSCTAFADPTIVVCERRCLEGEGPPGLAARDAEPAATGR